APDDVSGPGAVRACRQLRPRDEDACRRGDGRHPRGGDRRGGRNGRGARRGCAVSARSATRLASALAAALAAGCASGPGRDTLATLRSVEPDVAEVEVENSLELAMQSYRRYLDETARSPLTPEAMRRLADLKLEREFGIIGDGTRWIEMEAPVTVTPAALRVSQTRAPTPRRLAAGVETDEEFELRTTAELPFAPAGTIFLDELPAAAAADSGPLEAIEIYRRLL